MDELRWLVARHAESLFGGDEALAGTDDAEPSASPPEHHAATLRFDLSAATRPRFDLGALTPRVDLSALVRPTFDLSAATLRFDLSAATRPRFDLGALTPRFDLSALTPRVDLGALTPRVDLSALVRPTFDLSAATRPRFDLGALTPRVDLGALTPRVDLSALTPRVDLSALVRPTFDLSAATLRFDLGAATRPRFDLGALTPRFDLGALTPRVDLSALVRPTFDLSAVFGPALGTPFDFRVTALSQQLAEIVNAALIRPSFNAVIGRDLLEGADTLASSSPSNELARYRELQSLLVRVPVALVVGLVIGVALQELTPRQALVMALGLLLGWWPVDQDIARRIWSLESK